MTHPSAAAGGRALPALAFCSAGSRPRGRALGILLILAAGVFLARLGISVAIGWNTTDEAWNLRVVQRFLGGDVLYRDIYYGVTPLPVYIAALACRFLGVQAIVLKALSAAAFAGIFLATWDVLRRAGARVCAWPIALLIALVPISPYYTSALYNDLAPLLLLMLAAGALAWQEAPSFGRALRLGILLGLCIAAKQNVGIYAAFAVTAAVLFWPVGARARRWRHLAIAAISSAVIVAIVMLPVALAGAWHDMVVECFSNKSNYLRYAGLNFFDGFGVLAASALHLPERHAMVAFFWSLIFPLAIISPAVFIYALIRKPTRTGITLLGFLLVLGANVYPRADAGHVARAFPAMLIALILAAPAFPRPLARIVSIAGLSVAGLALAILLFDIPWRLASRQYVFSTLPHTRGLLLHVDEEARLRRLAAAIAAQPRPVFILSNETGALYLISEAANPTRYDFTLVNVYPAGAQQRIIESIQAGRIRSVVFQTRFPPIFVPHELVDYLTVHCRPTGTCDGYQFYSAPAPARLEEPESRP